MAISSINFQKVSTHSLKHNDRTEEKTAKTVFQEFSHKNICDTDSKSALQNFNELYKDSISKVVGKERRADKKNTLVEAVVNIKPNTTMEDLKNLQKHIEKEFGFKGLQIAIHRDEGHYDDNGKFVTNEHAHLSFFTLDRQNGRQMFRREHINRDKLRDLQTQTANILNMDRGKSKEETGRERLSHKDYKQAKQMESAKLKELQATKEQLKEANNQMRIFMKENGANRNDYAQLEQAKKELEEKLKAKDLTEKELLEKFQELEKNFKKEKGHLTSLIEVKEIDNLDLKNQNKSLQQQKEVLASKVIALEQKTASSSNMSDLEVKAELQNIVNEEIEVKNVKTGVFSTEKAPVIKDSKSFFKRVQDLASRGTQGVMNTIENLKREITQLKSFVKSLQTENANLKAKVRELESEAPKQIEVLKPEFQKIVEQAKEINENKKPIDKFKEIQKEVIEKQLEEKTTRRERRR
jgi:predicted RNase H-like nuclease (RuvC/YqgF family)